MKCILQVFVLLSICGLVHSVKGIECNNSVGVIAYTGLEKTGVEGDIYLYDVCSKKNLQITNDGSSFYPIWSPDGSQIVFQKHLNDQDFIYIMNADGTNVKVLSAGLYYAYFPMWSSNEYISFSGLASVNDRPQLYIVKSDGSDLHRVIESMGSVGYSAWSHDGKKLAFVTHLGEISQKLQIIDTVNYSSIGEISITGTLADLISWSSDDNTIAYASNGYIYLLDTTTLISIKLTKGHHPVWSPSDERILFDNYSQIYGINVYDNKQDQLTTDGDNYFPRWSSDGTQISFISYRGNDVYHSSDVQVYVMNSNGSNQIPVTELLKNLRQQDPTWKPINP